MQEKRILAKLGNCCMFQTLVYRDVLHPKKLLEYDK